MKFFKLLKYDIKNGFWQNRWRLLCTAAVVIISCIDFYIRKQTAFYFEATVPAGTFGDYACYLLGGMKEYVPGVDEDFIFPVKWFLFHLILLYGTLHYSVRDLHTLGKTMLPRCGQRYSWWISKCLWNFLYTMAAYLLTFGIIFLFCTAAGATPELSVTETLVNSLMQADSPYSEFPVQFTVLVLVLPCILSIGNSFFLLLLTLFFKPVFSYGIMIVFLLCGAYFHISVLWGTLTMPLRSEWIHPDGYSFSEGLLAAALIISITFVIGFIRFQKYDILNLESE